MIESKSKILRKRNFLFSRVQPFEHPTFSTIPAVNLRIEQDVRGRKMIRDATTPTRPAAAAARATNEDEDFGSRLR